MNLATIDILVTIACATGVVTLALALGIGRDRAGAGFIDWFQASDDVPGWAIAPSPIAVVIPADQIVGAPAVVPFR